MQAVLVVVAEAWGKSHMACTTLRIPQNALSLSSPLSSQCLLFRILAHRMLLLIFMVYACVRVRVCTCVCVCVLLSLGPYLASGIDAHIQGNSSLFDFSLSGNSLTDIPSVKYSKSSKLTMRINHHNSLFLYYWKIHKAFLDKEPWNFIHDTKPMTSPGMKCISPILIDNI